MFDYRQLKATIQKQNYPFSLETDKIVNSVMIACII